MVMARAALNDISGTSSSPGIDEATSASIASSAGASADRAVPSESVAT
jgi:hypothetical protein